MGAIVIRMRFDEGTESAEVATSGEICLQCESEVAIEKKTNKEIRCLQCEPEVTIENNIRIQVSINTLFLINQRKIDTYQE
jgi:hypothetical protein